MVALEVHPTFVVTLELKNGPDPKFVLKLEGLRPIFVGAQVGVHPTFVVVLGGVHPYSNEHPLFFPDAGLASHC